MHTLLEMRDRSLMLSPRQCIFLGYQKGVKGFKLWDPKVNKVVTNRDVIFDEKAMLQNKKKKMRYKL